MEDVRLGRKIAIVITNTVQTGTPQPIVDSDPDRVFLIFYPVLGSSPQLSTSPSPSATNGFRLLETNPPLMFDIKTHGQLVTKAWYMNGSITGDPVCVHQGRLEAE